MLNISKSYDYKPNLIINSFDSTYDQFQMIPEIFYFCLKKAYQIIFIFEIYMKSIFLTEN